MISVLLTLAAMAFQPLAACEGSFGRPPPAAPGEILWVGEMHGTAQAPLAMAGMLCDLYRAYPSDPIVLFLEQPSDDQARIDQFLAANSARAAERNALLLGGAWNARVQDGRNSQAMLTLLQDIGELQSRGAQIRVVAIDVPRVPADHGSRDSFMAAKIQRAMAEFGPQYRFLAFTGNYHNIRRDAGPNGNGSPSASDLLRRDGVQILALRTAAAGGTAWHCTPDCGVQPLQGGDSTRIRGIFIGEVPWKQYDGVLFLGPESASPPAFPTPPLVDRRDGAPSN